MTDVFLHNKILPSAALKRPGVSGLLWKICCLFLVLRPLACKKSRHSFVLNLWHLEDKLNIQYINIMMMHFIGVWGITKEKNLITITRHQYDHTFYCLKQRLL